MHNLTCKTDEGSITWPSALFLFLINVAMSPNLWDGKFQSFLRWMLIVSSTESQNVSPGEFTESGSSHLLPPSPSGPSLGVFWQEALRKMMADRRKSCFLCEQVTGWWWAVTLVLSFHLFSQFLSFLPDSVEACYKFCMRGQVCGESLPLLYLSFHI